MRSVCTIDGCTRELHGQGLCHTHYEHQRRIGNLAPLNRSVADRLAAHLVRMPNGCLEWTGATGPRGYGTINVNGVPMGTHRLAWQLANGPIPDGLFVCHHCDNPPCCDVEKCLFLGTNAENVADMIAKGRGFWQKKATA